MMDFAECKFRSGDKVKLSNGLKAFVLDATPLSDGGFLVHVKLREMVDGKSKTFIYDSFLDWDDDKEINLSTGIFKEIEDLVKFAYAERSVDHGEDSTNVEYAFPESETKDKLDMLLSELRPF